MTVRLLVSELAKLRGSLALVLLLVAPGLLGVLALLSMIAATEIPSWASILGNFVYPLWTLFLLPMAAATFATLVAQIEYKTDGWTHLLALPVPHWQIFLVKSIIVVAGIALMNVLVAVASLMGSALGGLVVGTMPLGPLPFTAIVRIAATVTGACLLLAAIQFWAALRFRNFVVPLALGIAGTLVTLAVMISQTSLADWFPWVLPYKAMLSTDKMPYLLFSGLGSLAVFSLLIIDVRRHLTR
ncbi:MAG: ABC transporter permease [Pseudomonadota bacterium]